MTTGHRAIAPPSWTRGGHHPRRRQQVVRRLSRAAGHQPDRHARRAGGGVRSVGLGQVDHDPLRQPPRGAPARPHHRRRRRADQRRPHRRADPPQRRHGVPAVQPVPAPDRARQPHPVADLGSQAAETRSRRDPPWSTWSGSTSRSRRTSIPGSFRAVSSSAWPSPGRCA